jgi:hypothetical protein
VFSAGFVENRARVLEEVSLEETAVGILEREKEQIDEITLGKQSQERTNIKGSSF